MKTLFKLLGVIVIVVAVVLVKQRSKANDLDIVLCNIEALASGESSSITCAGAGPLDCPVHTNGKYYLIITR